MKLSLLILVIAYSPGVIAQVTATDSTRQPIGQTTHSAVNFRTNQPRGSRNALRINPLSLALGQVSIFYERALSDTISIVAGYGQAGLLPDFNPDLERGSSTYQRLTLEGRYYWQGRALSGFYAGPYLRVTRLLESYSLLDARGMTLTDSTGVTFLPPMIHPIWIWIPGGMIGHQFRGKRFSLDTFLGMQFQLSSTPRKGSNQVVEAMTSAIAFRAGVSLGVVF